MTAYPLNPDLLGKLKPPRSKYNAQPVIVDGIRFDSRGEAKRWVELQLLERAGEIRNLRRQVVFPLVIDGEPVLIRSEGFPGGRAAKITLDFGYIENEAEVTEDFKGFFTPEAKLRIAVFEAIYKTRVRISRAR